MGFLNAIERSIRRAVLASLRLLSERKGSDGVLPEFSGDQGNPALLLIRIDRIGDEVARRYGVPRERVATHVYEPALAVKISLPRPIMSGDPGDRDVYGAQQHAPLLGIEI